MRSLLRAADVRAACGVRRAARTRALAPGCAVPSGAASRAPLSTSASCGRRTADKGFRDTLNLPSTPFSLRAHAAKRESLFRHATTTGLYRWQREHLGTPDGRDEFVLHDGPPYANGSLHMGHALNKILKDFIIRYQVLRGRRVHYMPGWDCHGLPIEIKAVAQFGEDADVAKLAPVDVRSVARGVAWRELARQRDEFQQFSILADWSDATTYRTMDLGFIASQLRVFAACVERGLVYQQYRPVYWSPSSRTALAEAEIEYNEEHLSRSIYVLARLEPNGALAEQIGAAAHGSPVHVVIWTTTPWSLLGNMAIGVNAEASYSLLRAERTGALYVVASDLVGDLAAVPMGEAGDASASRTPVGELHELARFPGAALTEAHYSLPFMPQGARRPLLAAPFVTTASGTGLVHMAPAHGQEDYALWRDSGLLAQHGLVSPVDDDSRFDVRPELGVPPAMAERLHGLRALTEGNAGVVRVLAESGALLGEVPYRHSYPIDWRTKQPVLTRATSQWFADLSHIAEDAQAALGQVQYVPSTGRTRLEGLVARRSEWCISRQRAWGVPLPIVYDEATGEPLCTRENIEHIIGVLEEHGSCDAWWTLPAERFVAPAYRSARRRWTTRKDTLDVWFDSGTSWSVLAQARGAASAEALARPAAHVYLEGTDQHRGWFQSSLLTRISAGGPGTAAPYERLVTHGFVVDSAGRKMSKSLGNVVAPGNILHGSDDGQYAALGTDVLRWWAAKADYTRDIPVSPLIMKHASDEVRKLRNSARFLLANAGGNQLSHKRQTLLPENVAQLGLLDRFILHELHALERACQHAYDAFDFAQVTRRLNEFVTATLSTLYLDSVKDVLYAGAETQRAGTVAVLDQLLRTLTSILAPILPHLAEDIHWYRNGATSDPKPEDATEMRSFFQGGWQAVADAWHDPTLEPVMHDLCSLRSDAFALVAQGKSQGHLRSASEVCVDVIVPAASEMCGMLQQHRPALRDLLSAANVCVVEEGTELVPAAWQLCTTRRDGVQVRVRPSPLEKCPRCWQHQREPSEQLCRRCADVVGV